jgi:hypothetical protein
VLYVAADLLRGGDDLEPGHRVAGAEQAPARVGLHAPTGPIRLPARERFRFLAIGVAVYVRGRGSVSPVGCALRTPTPSAMFGRTNKGSVASMAIAVRSNSQNQALSALLFLSGAGWLPNPRGVQVAPPGNPTTES